MIVVVVFDQYTTGVSEGVKVLATRRQTRPSSGTSASSIPIDIVTYLPVLEMYERCINGNGLGWFKVLTGTPQLGGRSQGVGT
jgi:hypothetical protein